MDSKTLKVACLTAGLAAAWAAPQAANAVYAPPDHFHYEMYIDPVYEMYNSYVVFNINTSGYHHYLPLGTLLTGKSTRTIELESYYEPDSYYIVGVYGDTAAGAVVSFGVSNPGSSWSSIFGYDNEQDVINWCGGDNTDPWSSPAPVNTFTNLWTPITAYTPTPAYNGFMFGFSDPKDAGDVQIMRSPAAVPEASTFMGFVTAAISLLGFKRFRK